MNRGNLATKRLTVSDGSASGDRGGGIYNNGGTLTVTDSTISNNTADINVGGIFSRTEPFTPQEATTIENSTISGNTATIRSATITNNTAPEGQGAGVASFGFGDTSTVVGSSIIAANDSTDVVFIPGSTNSFSSEGYNVIGDGNATGNFNATGDQTGVEDPDLGSLADNGGPTQTHALLSGSPAIDKGDDANCPQTDQRGVSRPNDGDADGTARCDIGAFELEEPDTTRPTITDLKPPPGSNPGRQSRDIKATVKDDRSDLMKEDMIPSPGEEPCVLEGGLPAMRKLLHAGKMPAPPEKECRIQQADSV